MIFQFRELRKRQQKMQAMSGNGFSSAYKGTELSIIEDWLGALI